MRFRISGNLLKDRRRLVILAIVLIVIIAVVARVPSTIERLSYTGVTAAFESDKASARVGEDFTFDASKSEGDNIRYRWDLGDGNTSRNSTVIHSYGTAGWYDVHLEVSDSHGNSQTYDKTVGVQQEDRRLEDSYGRIVDVNPASWQGIGPIIFGILPNIGQPTITGDWSISNAVGTFVLDVLIICEESATTYCEEHYTALREDLDVHVAIPAEDLPDDIITIEAIVWTDQGTWESCTYTFTVSFPMV